MASQTWFHGRLWLPVRGIPLSALGTLATVKVANPAIRAVWTLFSAAAACVVLRAVLVAHVIAAELPHNLAALRFNTDSLFREFDGVVLACCVAAFVYWAYAIWTLGGHWMLRVLRCAGALLASFVILVLLSRGLYAVPLLR